MGLLTPVSNVGIDAVTAMYAPQITGLVAGEDLLCAAPCFIKSSDGKVYLANGTAADEEAEVAGFTPRAVKSGEPVTLFGKGTRFRYANGTLTPGDIYYIGTTKGRLDTAATTGDAFGVAQAVTRSDIRVVCDTKPLTSATVGAGTISATELAANAVTTVKILAANVTEAKLEVGAAGAGISGLVTKFAADGNVIGAIPVIHRLTLTSGANGDQDVTLTHKTRVLDFWLVLKGAGTAGCTVTLKNVTTAITDAVNVAAGGDKAIFRAGTIDDAQQEIAAGAVMRISKASSGANFPGAECYVLGVRVA